MRVGILSRWNATCGVSLHAELIGRELMKKGHDITVLAPHRRSADLWWHHKIIRRDEDFVVRCYDERTPDLKGRLEAGKILSEDFDIFLVESYERLPYKGVEVLLRKIKCPKVAVIHEGKKEDIGYDLRNFDAIVVFDERFRREVVPRSVWKRTRIIPYPCIPPVRRRRRAFAEDVLRFFSFGRQPVGEYEGFVRALEALSRRYDFEYLVFRSDHPLPYNERWLKQEVLRLDTDELYDLLLHSDIHLLPKGATKRVVVSSTFSQCVGALTPIVAPHTRHFENLPVINGSMPAVIYKDHEELIKLIEKLVEDEYFRDGVIEAARIYAEENSVGRVTEEFLKLFESLKPVRVEDRHQLAQVDLADADDGVAGAIAYD